MRSVAIRVLAFLGDRHARAARLDREGAHCYARILQFCVDRITAALHA